MKFEMYGWFLILQWGPIHSRDSFENTHPFSSFCCVEQKLAEFPLIRKPTSWFSLPWSVHLKKQACWLCSFCCFETCCLKNPWESVPAKIGDNSSRRHGGVLKLSQRRPPATSTRKHRPRSCRGPEACYKGKQVSLKITDEVPPATDMKKIHGTF